ncbi:MAG: TetR/AcrR family transcriptional regulator [Burkholderiaceae bacterium]|nr:TetR/AcrR family transcriptional regulator [Burkholderiaceae bacterium]
MMSIVPVIATPAAPRSARKPSKGELTRAAIVDAALALAAREGLEGLTIGALAARMRMSKSGVFAHFGSREDLQIAVLKTYERRFVDDVLLPALGAPRGLPRLRAIFERWLAHTAAEAESGCVWISAATEYDDRSGHVRDELVAMIRSWQRECTRAIEQAIDAGHLARDVDPQDLLFAIYGIVLVVHHDARLLNSADAVARARRAFDRVTAAWAPQSDRLPVPEKYERSVARDLRANSLQE